TGKRVELVHHDVDGVLQLQNFALRVHRNLCRKVALGDGRGHAGNVTNLVGQVARHGVHGFRQIPPRSGDALHFRLAAQLPFGADFARHAGNFRCKRVELIHHGVNGVLQLQNFAARIDGNLCRKIASGHSRGHTGNVTNLVGQVTGHRVHAVGKILPHAGDFLHDGLAAELTFRTDFASHAGNFRCERVELVHHRVNGVLQLQNFAARIHRNLCRKVASRHGRGHACDVTDLVGQVAGHGVYVVGKILPHTGDVFHHSLAAQLTFRTDFAGHASYFRCERAKLVHHGVDGVLELQNFAARVHRDFAGEVALCHGRSHGRDVTHLVSQVTGHGVDRFGQIPPRARHTFHFRLAAEFAFRTYFARHARYFG